MYFSSDFVQWINTKVPHIQPGWEENDTAKGQLESEFFGFCDGLCLVFGSGFHWLDPVGSCVWELKTPDLRVFGWFPHRDHFVAHLGEEKTRLTDYKDYSPYVQEVVRYRDGLLPLLPAFVTEKGITDVVSNRPRRF